MTTVKWVTDPDDYQCQLSEETQKLAKEELREDKNTRDQALDQVRNWIKLNERIENSRLGKIITTIIFSFIFLISLAYLY